MSLIKKQTILFGLSHKQTKVPENKAKSSQKRMCHYINKNLDTAQSINM